MWVKNVREEKMVKKFFITTLLASVAVAGVFVDSAEARRRSKYSSRGFDEETVLSTYSIYDRLSDETPIVDVDVDPNLGLFIGAIEDYFKYSNSSPSGSDDGINDSQFEDNQIEILDLFDDAQGTVDLIPGISIDRQETVANFQAELIKGDDKAIEEALLDFDGRDAIRYSIVTSGTQTAVEVIGWLDYGAPSFRLSSAQNEQLGVVEALPNGFNLDNAINDISYILDNNLLLLTVEARPDDERELVPTMVLEGIEQESNIVSTPEHSGVLTIFALGVLGISSILKRKFKHI